MMYEKFKLKLTSNGLYYLYKDNEIIIPYINFQKWNKEDAEYLIGELNKLSDENDKLKQQIQVYEKSLIRKSKKISEQQVTIEEQNKEIEEWEFSFRTEMAHHRVAEKELQREQQTTISTLKEENEELHYKLQQTKELLRLIANACSFKKEHTVKEILRNEIRGIDTVTYESVDAWKDYVLLSEFFEKHYKEYWDND